MFSSAFSVVICFTLFQSLGINLAGVVLVANEHKVTLLNVVSSNAVELEMKKCFRFLSGLFLLESHRGTTFEDLKAGLAFLKRKVDGENETQLSFIKANVNSIVDQLVSPNNLTCFFTNTRFRYFYQASCLSLFLVLK